MRITTEDRISSRVARAFALLWMLVSTTACLAHPMGNFSINHYSGIHLERDVIEVRVRESTRHSVTLLFDPEHNLEERILNEQFVS